MTHPKRTPEEMQALANKKRQAREHELRVKQNMKANKVAIQLNLGLKFWHKKPEDANMFPGGMTVAYRPVLKDVIEVSTALLHKDDVFCRYKGSFYAADNFANGKVIQLRKPKDMSVPEFLETLFL